MKRLICLLLGLILCGGWAWAERQEPPANFAANSYQICWDTDLMDVSDGVAEVYASRTHADFLATNLWDADTTETAWRSEEFEEPWTPWPHIEIELTAAHRIGALRLGMAKDDSSQLRPDRVSLYVRNDLADDWGLSAEWDLSPSLLSEAQVVELIVPTNYTLRGRYLMLQLLNYRNTQVKLGDIEVYRVAGFGGCD